MHMLREIKFAFRQALGKPALSILMTLGIALGVCASLLLARYILWQYSFDRFHDNGANIVRVQNDHLIDGQVVSRNAMTYSGVPVLAKERFPAVKEYVRLGHWIANDVLFRHDEALFRGKDCLFADASFFDVFSFKLLKGDPKTALTAPNSLLLTEAVALKLFGDDDPMGQEVLFENFKTFVVTGVVEDPGPRSHIQFDLLASMSTMSNWGLQVYGDDQFESSYVYAYLQLQEQADLAKLTEDLNQEVAAIKASDQQKDRFALQPLEEIHLYSKLENELGETGNGENLRVLAIIALLIIVLAWLNHINIFSALGVDQFGSLSIRRIVGAERRHLFQQVFFSGAIYSVAGLVLGLVMLAAFQPLLANLFDIPALQLSSPFTAIYLMGLVLTLLVGSVLICLLPATLLSRISPKEFLEKKQIKLGNLNLRRGLVIVQFTIIVVLLISTGIVYLQMDFLQQKKLGLQVDQVVAVPAPLGMRHDNMKTALPQFVQEIRGIPGITSMSTSHDIPGNQLKHIEEIVLDGQERKVSLYRNYGDINYFETYQIPFVQLDQAAKDEASDQKRLVLNEQAARQLGFTDPASAIGHEVAFWGNDPQIILGVIADHHQRSLHHPILPLVYNFSQNGLMTDGYYSLRLDPKSDGKETLAKVQDAYQQSFPHTVFESIHVDEHFRSQYRADDHFKKLNLAFTIVGAIVACFGLLGLIIIAVSRRTKEISIRKTLGASIQSIFLLLSSEFFKLVFIAIALAIPIAYYFGSSWLDNFAYQTGSLIVPFVVAVVLVLLLTLATVSHHCVRAARVDPVEGLREE